MLLDLGDYQPASLTRSEEFELDVDLNEVQESSTEVSSSAWSEGGWESVPKPIEDPFATTRDLTRGVIPNPVQEGKGSGAQTTFTGARIGGHQPGRTDVDGSQGNSFEGFPPEVIDAIARRAVEHLSERVVQEIAWEVVPQLAELLIKRQLEEKNS